jgi:hypothetical protein
MIMVAPNGATVALKVLDGSGRAATAIALALLERVGAVASADVAQTMALLPPSITGRRGGRPHPADGLTAAAPLQGPPASTGQGHAHRAAPCAMSHARRVPAASGKVAPARHGAVDRGPHAASTTSVPRCALLSSRHWAIQAFG